MGAITAGDAQGPVQGVADLSNKLLASTTVQDCVVGNGLRFAQGSEVTADSCALSKMRKTFQDSGQDLREAILSVTLTDGFQMRRLVPGEVTP